MVSPKSPLQLEHFAVALFLCLCVNFAKCTNKTQRIVCQEKSIIFSNLNLTRLKQISLMKYMIFAKGFNL